MGKVSFCYDLNVTSIVSVLLGSKRMKIKATKRKIFEIFSTGSPKAWVVAKITRCLEGEVEWKITVTLETATHDLGYTKTPICK